MARCRLLCWSLVGVVAALLGGVAGPFPHWRLLVCLLTSAQQAQKLWFLFASAKGVPFLCEDDWPWLLWAQSRYELAVARLPQVPVQPAPVLDVPASLQSAPWAERERYVCSRLAERGGWGMEPFVVRGLFGPSASELLEDDDAWSLAWLRRHVPDRELSAFNMTVFGELFDEIRPCHHMRKHTRTRVRVDEVTTAMEEANSPLYVNFAEEFFGEVTFQNHRRRTPRSAWSPTTQMMRRTSGADRIWDLCSGEGSPTRPFGGYSGEAFFGVGAKQTVPVGTPVHSAYMRNLFLQLRGRRLWRLWSPAYTSLFRAQGNLGYMTGFGVHRHWSAQSDDDGFSLNATYAEHLRSVPSMSADLGPGDMLYVPPWWLHDTRVHGGYSLGFSARGQDWPGAKLWEMPALRFMGPQGSLEALALDILQVIPIYIVDKEFRGRRPGWVEKRQHGF